MGGKRGGRGPDSLISFDIFIEETFSHPAEGRAGVELQGNNNTKDNIHIILSSFNMINILHNIDI